MDMQQMLNIQLVWTFQSYPTSKSTPLEIMFWPQDVALVDPTVVSDFPLLLILKKEENWKLQLLSHYYPSKVQSTNHVKRYILQIDEMLADFTKMEKYLEQNVSSW